ncbi:MAG: type II toxin-antitoxin system HipA family toxin [Gammaproteobacteria bacterium]|nr:type II toxin-antitoxin system HipA family toxin [Gammaproteobacteria bacterium]
MARQGARAPLNVFLNARLAGRLSRQASGAVSFRYDPGWLDWEHALPISISLPLREDRYAGAPVIAVLDNLLPDPEPVRRRIAERIGVTGHDAYSLLAGLGRDCAGALQILPEGQDPGPTGTIGGRAMDDGEIRTMIRNLAKAPLGLDDDAGFRISLAGAQEKTALLHWQDKWHIPHGTTPTTHILKPRIGMLPDGIDPGESVENEYLCLRLTGALGLPSATARLIEFDGECVLAVERFDRQWTGDGRLLRLPQEDCCQALSVPPSIKYETDGGPGITAILDLLQGSDEPMNDRRMFLKAQIVFWLLGATDGHAKNFSIFLRPGGRFRMTPLYDVMSLQPAVDKSRLRKNRFRLALAAGDNRHYTIDTIFPRHFTQTALKAGMPAGTVREICDELLDRTEPAIQAVLDSLPPRFPSELADSVVGGMTSRLRRLGHAIG